MKWRSPAVVGVLLVPLVVAAFVAVALFAAPVPKKLPDDEVIVGRWKLVEIQLGADGEKPRNGWVQTEWEFRKDGTVSISAKGVEPVEGTFKIDPGANPKSFDATGEIGRASCRERV